MKKLNQVLSVAISAAIAVTSAPWPAHAEPAGPAFLQTFTPPSRLGYVTSSFQGKTTQPIIMIQDLHANYGVQKKVVELLKFMQPNATPKGEAMVLGREAAWDQVDLSFFQTLAPKDRKKVLDILMKNAEVTAKEHFAAMSETPVNMTGIDSKADYLLLLGLVRRSAGARLRLATKVNELNDSLQAVKSKAPANLRRLLKAEEDYRNGKLGMDEMARKLHVDSIPTYDALENRLLERKIELAGEAGKDAGTLTNVIVADHFLSLLSRLLRQQMTLEEVKMVARQSDRIEGIVKTFLPNEDLNEWKEIINAAVDYYAIAMVRDRPLSENSIALAESHPNQPIVVVVGGFHSAGMEQIFRERNMSFVTIAPIVESHTVSDEMLYLKRILGNHMDAAEIHAAVSEAQGHTAELADTMAPAAGVAGVEPTIREVTAEVLGQAPVQPATTPADLKEVDSKGDQPKKEEELNPVYMPGKAYVPTAKDTEAKVSGALSNVIETALGFFDANVAQTLKAKIASGEVTFVVAEHDAAAQTFRNVDGTGKTVIVINKSLFDKGGNVALMNVAKELVNVSSDKRTVEADTLPEFFRVAGKAIGLEAVRDAYAEMGAGAAPLVDAINDLIHKGLTDPAKWSTNDIEQVREVVDAALKEIDRLFPGFRFESNGTTEKELMPVNIPGEAQPWASSHFGIIGSMHEKMVQALVSRFTLGGRQITPDEQARIEAAKQSIMSAA